MLPETIKFTAEQKATFKATFASVATADQFNYFIEECERRALIPGTHVVFSLRGAKEYNLELKRTVDVQKVVLITTINALRLIAERNGKFRGYGRFKYYYNENGSPTLVSDIPLGKVPHAVSIELFREGWIQPVFAVARYDAYVQLKSGDGGKDVPTLMWRQRGEEQLAKCAEALGLRMVAPEECGGLYIEEELQHNSKEDTAITAQETAQPSAPVVVPKPTVAPPVNQLPAPIQAAPTEPVTPATPTPAPVAVPSKPALPSRPAMPVKPAIPAPKATATAPGPVPNRQPQVEQPVKESPAELQEFADRVARDTTPAKPYNNPNITDADLPEILQPKAEAAANPSPAPVAVTPTPSTTVAPPAAAGQTADAPMTATENKTLMERAAKVVRDKLEKEGGLKNAGSLLKDYLLKKTGKTKIVSISAAAFVKLIEELEKTPAAEAVAIVKEGVK